MNKICDKCHRSLPISEFYKITTNKQDLRSICKDCQNDYNDTYRKTFNGKTSKALSNAKNKAKLLHKNLSHNFTVDEWRKKIMGTKGVCLSCRNAVGICSITMDHVIPLSEAPNGFSYSIDDVQPLCSTCNTKKGKCSILYFIQE